jgi:pheromone shutdown protein TraB
MLLLLLLNLTHAFIEKKSAITHGMTWRGVKERVVSMRRRHLGTEVGTEPGASIKLMGSSLYEVKRGKN